jgi:hypothetical protein
VIWNECYRCFVCELHYPASSAVPLYSGLIKLTLDSYQPQKCQEIHAHFSSSGGAFAHICLIVLKPQRLMEKFCEHKCVLVLVSTLFQTFSFL